MNPAAAVVATLGVVLAAVYVLWTYQRVFTGPVRPGLETMRDVGGRERWAVAPLVVLMLVLGFVPGQALDLVRPPAELTLEAVGEQDPGRQGLVAEDRPTDADVASSDGTDGTAGTGSTDGTDEGGEG